MSITINNSSIQTVKIVNPIIPSGTMVINADGTYNVYSYNSINVDIQDLLDVKLTSTLNISEYIDLSASKINPYAFISCSTIKQVNMPNVISIYSSAFCQCINLTSAYFPSCSYMGSNIFTSCYNLSEIYLPVCSYFAGGNFSYCSNLVSINLPELYTIQGNYCFRHCIKLQYASLPKIINLNNYAFAGCSALTSVYIPIVPIIGDYCFSSCYNLSTISLTSVSNIRQAAFSNCYNLLSVYLNVSSVPSLANVNAFTSTPISNYTTSTGGVYGSIFVPTSLYSSFITATNWANYSSRIVSMNF